jgi:hypothetical protein
MTDPIRINMTTERLRVESGVASLHHPTFIPSPTVATTNPSLWHNTILAVISTYTFFLFSLPDIDHLRRLLACPELPNLWKAITSIDFPEFYQFAGIRDNRTSNPYLDFTKGLASLERLGLTFHSAGLTTSVWHERERLVLENQGLIERSKELRVRRTAEVVAFYKLEDVFEMRETKLESLTLTLVDSELVGHFVKTGSVLALFGELEGYFKQGFESRGMSVEVRLVVCPLPYTG